LGNATAAALTAAVAVLVFVSAHAEGSYFASAWPLLGAVLVVAATALMLLQASASGWQAAAAASLAIFGLVALASVEWGGLPDIAWKTLDAAVIGGAALLLGSLISGVHARGPGLVLTGVLCGSTALALELVYRLQAGSAPSSWFDGRKVEGPVMYHNAQGAFFAIGIPLALWATTRRPGLARAAGGFACLTLIAALLVTQSRGALLATLAAVVVQLALAREARLVAHAVLASLLGAALVIPFRDVDAALVNGSNHAAAQFRSFAGWGLLAAAVLAAIAALPRTRTVRRGLVGLTAVLVVAALAVGAPHAGDLRPAIHRALNGEEPTSLPGGQTRLSSLSLTGRKQIWRVAVDSYRDAPLLGHGSGSFTEIFTRERKDHNLYVLQPHSIELEVLAELGLPGAAAFAGFIVLLAIGLVRGRASRAGRAAAAAVLVALLAQASLDWTFSFPALVAAALLVAGAATGRGSIRVRAAPASLALTAVAAAALVSLGGPYLATHDLSRAREAATPDRAWQLLRRARGFDPWNAEVIDYQAQVAENAGRFREAAALYGHASTLARISWAEEYRRARALREGGFIPASKEACLRARSLNPLEPLLTRGLCATA
jgi:hypothetical protein